MTTVTKMVPQHLINATNAVFLLIYGAYPNPNENFPYPAILTVTRHDGTVGFIGGKVEPGETLIEALKREVYEETRYALQEQDERNLKYITSHIVPPIEGKDRATLCTHLFAIFDSTLLAMVAKAWATTCPNAEIPGITTHFFKNKIAWERFRKLPFALTVKEELYEFSRMLDWDKWYGFVIPDPYSNTTDDTSTVEEVVKHG